MARRTTSGHDLGDQLSLVPPRVRPRRSRVADAGTHGEVADPVAEVVVDVPLAHLDRTFDYLVPASMADTAVPGARVRVRFAGAAVDGWVVARRSSSAHEGALSTLARVVSPEPVLDRDLLALCRAVADRYAGTLVDVVRTAVPPRHARVEAEERPPAVPLSPVAQSDPGPWRHYAGGEAFHRRLADVGAPHHPGPRAVWTALPGEDPATAIAVLVTQVVAADRGAIVVVPDGRDVRAFDEALHASLGEGRHVTLTAGSGAATRYRAWLALRRGDVRVVVGTRATAFAPVRDLGLLVVWDDGDDVHEEPHSPGWNVREVLALRAHLGGAALLVGGWSQTVAAAALLERGWAREVVATRAVVRSRVARVTVTGDDVAASRDPAARSARVPLEVLTVARMALTSGPVLVQVPRVGYVPALVCRTCRTRAACPACGGALRLTSGHAIASCARCGRLGGDVVCAVCGDRRLRAAAVGSGRTAEELGRAFPGVPILESSAGRVRDRVDALPRIVVATPGAEPVASDGYAAGVLLDARALLDRPTLRADEEAVRRWFAAVALVRPAGSGGRVVIVGDADSVAVQAVVRHDPSGFAARQFAERAVAGLPPATRVATVTGDAPDVTAFTTAFEQVPGAPDVTVLGPVPLSPASESQVRAILTASRADTAGFLASLTAVASARSARRDGGPVSVRVDPVDLD